jgi:hypothetical protein
LCADLNRDQAASSANGGTLSAHIDLASTLQVNGRLKQGQAVVSPIQPVIDCCMNHHSFGRHVYVDALAMKTVEYRP